MAESQGEPAPLAPARGVVRMARPDGLLDGRRYPPSKELAPYIHHFWHVRWSLRSPYAAEALSYPSSQIIHSEVTGQRRAVVHGVHTTRLTPTLAGEGQRFGITFRPAMFQPLWNGSMAALTDAAVPLGRVLGKNAREWSRAILGERDPVRRIAIAETFLAPLLPRPAARLVRLRDLVESIAHDSSVVRAEDIAATAGVELRALQRSFQTYVGVSPKWVIQRFRLHEALARLARPHPPALADLAASLGYADQAHFGRDFKRFIGEPPQSFVRSRARADEPRSR